MLHGLGGDRNQPLGLLDGDPDPRVSVLAPDQRAHGETTVIGEPCDFQLDRLADDATALLRQRGLESRPIIVVGISMGAAVALRVLQRHQHDLRGAMLIRPAFETEPWPAHLRVFRDIAVLLRSHGPSGVDEFVQTAAYRAVAEVSDAAATRLREQFTKPGAVERVVRLENVPANPSIVWNGAWTPPCAVTVVGAAEDPVHPMATAELWQERIAGADLLRVPSRDRFPEDYRDDSRNAVREFLSAHAC